MNRDQVVKALDEIGDWLLHHGGDPAEDEGLRELLGKVIPAARQAALSAATEGERTSAPRCPTCGAALDVLGGCMAAQLHATPPSAPKETPPPPGPKPYATGGFVPRPHRPPGSPVQPPRLVPQSVFTGPPTETDLPAQIEAYREHPLIAKPDATGGEGVPGPELFEDGSKCDFVWLTGDMPHLCSMKRGHHPDLGHEEHVGGDVLRYIPHTAPPPDATLTEAARLVRETPLAPGTHTGTRQRWVLESAARRLEGREAPVFEDASTPEPKPDATGGVVQTASAFGVPLALSTEAAADAVVNRNRAAVGLGPIVRDLDYWRRNYEAAERDCTEAREQVRTATAELERVCGELAQLRREAQEADIRAEDALKRLGDYRAEREAARSERDNYAKQIAALRAKLEEAERDRDIARSDDAATARTAAREMARADDLAKRLEEAERIAKGEHEGYVQNGRRAALAETRLEEMTKRADAAEATLSEHRKQLDNCEAVLSAVRAELADAEAKAKEAERERDALAKFKAYVHYRLDNAGVPTHPNGEHSKAYCRVGDRLDLLIGARDEALRERDYDRSVTIPALERRIAEAVAYCEGFRRDDGGVGGTAGEVLRILTPAGTEVEG